MNPDLAAIAARHGGVFTRAEALQCGYPRREVDAMLRTGVWVALRHGCYAESALITAADGPRRHALEVAAAQRVVRDAVGSHESAALVHGLTLWPEAEPGVVLSRDGRNERTTTRRGLPLLIHGASVPVARRVAVHGATVSSVARTVVELAVTRDLMPACVTAEAALHADRVTAQQLEAAAATFGGDLTRVMQVLDIAGPESESGLETVSWVRFHEFGVPLPERQRQVWDARGLIGRVDYLWRAQRVVGEADGLQKYRAGGDALIREKLRQERLEDAGHTVVRWGWSDMWDRPAETMERIVRRLRRAA